MMALYNIEGIFIRGLGTLMGKSVALVWTLKDCCMCFEKLQQRGNFAIQ